ncbi:MAG TPA: type II secretion system F family protein [Solibacterales bacterium]|nr:type II secretion system F family protein [Bryobacterales bacterium]
MTLAIVAFVALFILITSAGFLLFSGVPMLKRLDNVITPDLSGNILGRFVNKHKAPSVAALVEPFEKILPRSAAEVSVVTRRLVRAGFRKEHYVRIFYGAKVLTPIALCLVVVVTHLDQYFSWFAYALALGLGFMIPDFWLGNRIKARQLAIRLGLPDALDLIVVCIEAGLSLDKATLRTADEMQFSQPAISDELKLVNLEQRAGRARTDAWRNFADRTDVESVRSMVAVFIQADQFGTSISKALRVHSDTMRVQRRQHAEEQAAKTTVKLVFPLVFFIFPSIFLVTLGPAMITIMEGFDTLFQ